MMSNQVSVLREIEVMRLTFLYNFTLVKLQKFTVYYTVKTKELMKQNCAETKEETNFSLINSAV